MNTQLNSLCPVILCFCLFQWFRNPFTNKETRWMLEMKTKWFVVGNSLKFIIQSRQTKQMMAPSIVQIAGNMQTTEIKLSFSIHLINTLSWELSSSSNTSHWETKQRNYNLWNRGWGDYIIIYSKIIPF